MDSEAKLYLERAENKVVLAKINFEISIDANLKNILKISLDRTFFNDIIADCYFSIFYAAKAYLAKNRILIKMPSEHFKTFIEFEKIVNTGNLDKELIKIYSTESEKAVVLLDILKEEKIKRGRFTYDMNSNANIPYAQESLDNARKFVSIIKGLIENKV